VAAMIIVTDAHIGKSAGNDTAFFQMLAAFEKTRHDLIFLGDIFDLWIAIPRYEDDIHARFGAWCRSQKNIRTIGFLEGNHEFFLADEKLELFTWCSKDGRLQDNTGLLFVHGDQMNGNDKIYLNFRRLAKNRITKSILRVLPYGPALVGSLQRRLNRINNKSRGCLPKAQVEKYAESRFAEGVDTIFAGHFHREYRYRNAEAKELYVLPDWFGTQKITIYRAHPEKITTIHWKELAADGWG
jgi:UDP-2,3-diacylglucosamine hydrolase